MVTFLTEDQSSKSEHVQEFLRQSNLIESEASDVAFEDACIAWDWLIKQAALNYDVVVELHRLLMHRLRPDIAGKLRNCDVFIGNQRKKYTDEGLILWELGVVINGIWLSLQGETITRIPFRLAAKSHVMFEECHPFVDGNGRVGRMLYNWHRLKLKLPVHVIHTGREQNEYYTWFTKGV